MTSGDPAQEIKLSETLAHVEGESNPDQTIMTNATTQIMLGFVLGVVFLFCRQRAPYVYYPNSDLRPNHPCHKYTGLFDWVKPITSLSDIKLLGMVGLDGFMLLQTLKLCYRVFFILSICYLPLFIFYYQAHKTDNISYFEKFSLRGTNSNIGFAVCLFLTYTTTIFIFYVLFIYYKRYVTLRQIYMVSPASLTSIETLKELTKQLHSYENSVEFINIASKTVILDRLPAYLRNDQDVYDYVTELGIGQVRNAILIQDTYYLTKLYEKRDVILQDIEKEIDNAIRSMGNHYVINKNTVSDSFKETYGNSLLESALRVFGNMKFDIEGKVKLLNTFVQNGNKFLSQAGKDTSFLIVYIEQLRYCNQKILEEKEKLSKLKEIECTAPLEQIKKISDGYRPQKKNEPTPSIYDQSSGSTESENTPTKGKAQSVKYKETPNANNVNRINYKNLNVHTDSSADSNESCIYKIEEQEKSNNVIQDAGNSVFIRSDIEENVSFFSFTQIRNYNKYKNYFTLDVPINKQKAFVTFSDVKQSGLIKQSQIGTRVFSPVATSSPAPNDIIWKNITKPEISVFFGRLGSTAMFIGYNILFYFVVSSLIKMLDLTEADSNWLLRYIKQSDTLASYYNGILAPGVYNLCILITPFILDFLINMEGVKSFSLSQIRLMKLFSLFLFYNAFLSIFFSTSFFSMVKEFLEDRNYKFNVFLNDLGNGYSKHSLFFMNTVIQRIIGGSIMTLLKPGPFFINFVLYHFQTRTRRQEEELHLSPPFDFGNVMPQVLLIFPISLSYGCVCPIMLFLGYLYYLINYFVYKNELVYSQRNPYESGGVFWTETSMFLIYSVMAFQLSTIATLFAEKFSHAFIHAIPMLVMDYYFCVSIKSLFDKNVKNYPLNEPEEEFLDEFSAKFIGERKIMLENWSEKEKTEDEDLFPISELGLHDKNIVTNTSHYKDPSTAINISHIMLPQHFYKIIQYLRTFDSKNVFGFNLKATVKKDTQFSPNTSV